MNVRPTLVPLEDRHTPAAVGSLDPTLNTTGTVDVAFDLGGNKADRATAVAVQADGRVIVVGAAQGDPDLDFAVARLNVDGSLDKSFGVNGLVAIGFDLGGANRDEATGVVVDSAGRIVVVGFAQVDASGGFDFAITRLTTNGKLDTTFDDDGRLTIAFDVGGTKDDRATSVALDSAGRIVVAGASAQATAGDFDFAVARVSQSGGLDTNFNGTGRTEISFDAGGANRDEATGVVVDANDRVVLVGTIQVDGQGDTDVGVARLTAGGKLDNSFDTDGRQTLGFDQGGTNADTAAGVALDASNRILVVATVAAGATDTDIGVGRLTTSGGLDTTFDTDGRLVLGFDQGGGQRDTAAGLVVDPQTQRFVIAATVEQATANDTDVGLARFTSDGNLDPAFDADGRQTISFDRGGSNADTAAGVAIGRDGRIVTAATVATATAADTDIGIGRVFGTIGRPAGISVGGTTNGTADLFVQQNGALIRDGRPTVATTATARPATADVNGDGTPDTILGVGPGGGSRVRVQINLPPELRSTATPPPPIDFDAFEGSFTGGVFVAAADIDGDGRAEIAVSPDVGGGGRVSVYAVTAANTVIKRTDFFGIDDPNFRGGARVAMGDVSGDGRADLVVGAGFLGGPRVAVFDGASLATTPTRVVNDFFAFPGTDATTLRNGVFVTVGDLNGDGRGDLIFGGGPGGGPRVFALDGNLIVTKQLDTAYAKPVANFFVNNDGQSRGGVRLAVTDLDGDDRAELVTGSGDGLPSRVRIYRGSTVVQPNGVEPPLLQEFDPFGQTLATGVFVG